MGKFQSRLQELLKDKEVIKEFRFFYHKGDITAEMLAHLLQTGKLTLSEYLGIIHEGETPEMKQERMNKVVVYKNGKKL